MFLNIDFIIFRKFYKKYGSVGIIHLSEKSHQQSLSTLFIEEYNKVEKEQHDLNEEELFNAAEKRLEKRGFYLQQPQKLAPPITKVLEQNMSWQCCISFL